MPIAQLSRTDPTTGETVYYEQPYTPGPDPAQQAWLEEQAQQRQQQQMMQMAQQARSSEAMKAVAAAIQFQGMRQYQNDVAKGMPKDQALARNAVNMFFGNPGDALKAMSPAPAMTPYQQEMISLARQRLAASAPKPEIRSVAGGGLLQVNPDGTTKVLSPPRPPTTDFETITETIPAVAPEEAKPAVPAIPFQKKSLLGIDWLWPDQQAKPAQSAVVPHGEQRVTRRVPAKKDAAPLSESVAPAAPPSGKRIRVKSPEGKIGTISEESLQEALNSGYTKL